MFELNKIGFVKRASALLLDAILLVVLATGFMWIISLICRFEHQQKLGGEYYSEWEDFRKENIADIAEYYGFLYEENEDGEYTIVASDGESASIDDVILALEASGGNDAETAELYKTHITLVRKVNMQYKYVFTMLFMMVSLGTLLSYLVLEFILPIILKNGQTVGKKVFGIGLVQPNCVKISNVSLFARTFVGKFAIETMFPILLVFLFLFGGLGWLAIALFAAITILNVVLFFATKNKTPIHDILAGTVAIELSVQLIFKTEQELAEKKALL